MSEITRYCPSDLKLTSGYDALAGSALTKPKLAQEIPSWMVDDDIGVNLCDVCGNPVRYGSRHHMCGQDAKKEK
jgi:hypothetical protein